MIKMVCLYQFIAPIGQTNVLKFDVVSNYDILSLDVCPFEGIYLVSLQ